MTVGELMELLAQYPPDRQVYDIDGMSIEEPAVVVQAGLAAAAGTTGPQPEGDEEKDES